jgi:rsbT co-antagonist protein RsbR
VAAKLLKYQIKNKGGMKMVETKKTEILTPVNILWDNILMVSIFGILESKRTQDLMESMLTKVSETGYKTIILDILGVITVDSAVANHLIKITKGTKLMGCVCIVSGISPAIAQTLVNLGIDLGNVITTSTLRDALEIAFDNSGLEVRKK